MKYYAKYSPWNKENWFSSLINEMTKEQNVCVYEDVNGVRTEKALSMIENCNYSW